MAEGNDLIPKEETGLVPASRAFVTIDEGAQDRGYLGKKLHGFGAHQASVYLDDDLRRMMGEIVLDPRSPYQTVTEFVQHALTELINTYLDYGLGSPYDHDLLARRRAAANTLNQLRMRQELASDMAIYAQELRYGADAGDWQKVMQDLQSLDDLAKRSPDLSWIERARKTIAQNEVVMDVVDRLYESTRFTDLADDGEYWQKWLESFHNEK